MNDRRETSNYLLTLAAILVGIVAIVGGYGLTVLHTDHPPWQDIWVDVAVGMLLLAAGLVIPSLLLRRPAPPPAPLTPLETWLQARIDAAEEIKRQRPTRGEAWYRSSMGEWDVENCNQLYEGDEPVAPDLLDNYRCSPKTGLVDGPGPPHDTAEYDRYYGERLSWCRHAFRASRDGMPIKAPLENAVPDAHRDELQEIAAGLMEGSLRYERSASYHPPGRDGTVLLAESFQAHFPAIARMLAEWDGLLQARQSIVQQLWERMDKGWDDRAQLPPPTIVYTQIIEAGKTELPWVQNDWLTLGGGHGIAEVTDGLDIDEVKRPYDEFLLEVLATDLAGELVAARRRIDTAKVTITEQLERLRAQHVIRGTCDLCAAAAS